MVAAFQPSDAAKATVACVAVERADRVAVLCNPPQRRIADAIAVAAAARGAEVELVEYLTLTRHGEEPPTRVAQALTWASAALAPTVYSLSHTRARVAGTERGLRFAGMSSMTEQVFVDALPVDYRRLDRDAGRVARAIGGAGACRITSAAGTDLVLDLGGRPAHVDGGRLGRPGAFGNLPAGEAYVAPLEHASEGVVVFDGSLAGYGRLTDPLRVEVAGGRVVAAAGGGAGWLLDTLTSRGEEGLVLAELGIGVNPSARVCGINIVDEKALGTAHVAFGTNVSFGGRNAAGVHIDAVMRRPSITVDGRPVMEEGRLRP
jgi:leucyl aminopeptidase (aminopeptidase T)